MIPHQQKKKLGNPQQPTQEQASTAPAPAATTATAPAATKAPAPTAVKKTRKPIFVPNSPVYAPLAAVPKKQGVAERESSAAGANTAPHPSMSPLLPTADQQKKLEEHRAAAAAMQAGIQSHMQSLSQKRSSSRQVRQPTVPVYVGSPSHCCCPSQGLSHIVRCKGYTMMHVRKEG